MLCLCAKVCMDLVRGSFLSSSFFYAKLMLCFFGSLKAIESASSYSHPLLLSVWRLCWCRHLFTLFSLRFVVLFLSVCTFDANTPSRNRQLLLASEGNNTINHYLNRVIFSVVRLVLCFFDFIFFHFVIVVDRRHTSYGLPCMCSPGIRHFHFIFDCVKPTSSQVKDVCFAFGVC